MRRCLALSMIVIAMSFACSGNSHPVDEPVCGAQGDDVELPTGRQLCVYRHEIVIETGFSCPAQRPDLFQFEPHFGTCSDFGPPIDLERDFLVDRYGVPGRPWPVSSDEPVVTPTTDQIDLLWVIDNSNSMCQEQAQLQSSFEGFVLKLAAQRVDFQLAITTTDMNPDFALEPVSQPGLIQSTPQPVPGFDASCHTAVDEMGRAIAGDYSPIRRSLAVAVGCMATPDLELLDVTDDEISCALYGPAGCAIARAGCGVDACTPEDIFPPPDSYREIPKILRSLDYIDDDGLNATTLVADFACASLVGTRGYGIEKGLAAAVAAVDPQNAGPNEGLVRPDARFALMFVSDENDCSHDGSLREDTACGGDVCEFANVEGALGGPLVAVSDLKAQFLANLALSKGRDVAESEVFVGAIVGQSKRYEGPAPSDAECADPTYEGVGPACATSLGVAFSGDRYERFLAQFVNGYPLPNEPNATTGWMCRGGDFSPALGALGEWLGASFE